MKRKIIKYLNSLGFSYSKYCGVIKRKNMYECVAYQDNQGDQLYIVRLWKVDNKFNIEFFPHLETKMNVDL